MCESTTLPLPPPTGPALRWEATYPGTRDQVRRVRAALRSLLRDCPAADDVILLVDELCANAIVFSGSGQPGGTFTVRVQNLAGDCVRAEVQDQGSTAWDGDLAGSAGRPHGLYLLLRLASESGVDGDSRARIVWFRIDLAGSEG